MLKKKISVMLVALIVTIAIPGMAFASEQATVDSSLSSLTEAGSISEVGKSISSDSEVSSDTSSTESGESNTSDEDTNIDNNVEVEKEVVEEPAVETPVDEQSAEEEAELPEEGEMVISDVEEPAVKNLVEKDPVAEETTVDQPIVEKSAIEDTVVEEPIVVIEESTLIIHHLFEYKGVVCDDYETIEKLISGETVSFGKYSYEDEHEFVNCINGKESVELQAGENKVTIKYTLKNGFKIN